MIYDVFDVVIVPVPFTDRNIVRKRPAVVLSRMMPANLGAQSVMAMITAAGRSARPLDTAVSDLVTAGLRRACVIRMKLFTFDQRLARTGQLAGIDRAGVRVAIKQMFGEII